MVFEIPLAEQKVKPHQVTALHLVTGFILLAVSAIAWLLNSLTLPGINGEAVQTAPPAFDMPDAIISVAIIISVTIIISALFRNKWLRSVRVNRVFRIVELIAAIIAVIFLVNIELTVPAALVGLLAATIIFSLFWEHGKEKLLLVIISDQGIKPPLNLKRRNINWWEVDKVLLRHGNLTINCADNRMYQWTTATHHTDTQIFEAYCDAQIAAAARPKKEEKEDW